MIHLPEGFRMAQAELLFRESCGCYSPKSAMREIFGKVGTWIFCLLLVVAVAKGELPPEVYRDLQQEAEEELRVQVWKVTSKPAGIFDRSHWTETVEATVVEVVRSKSGVKKGDVISIIYGRQVPKKGWVGPSPPPQLKEGGEYPAFLKRDEGQRFSIAARGMSFSRLE